VPEQRGLGSIAKAAKSSKAELIFIDVRYRRLPT
jgi:hypothetical protein